jgi:hypothetical protein
MIDEQYIKSLPLTTNKIEVTFDKEAFLSKYSIVSYFGTNKESKNLAYEQFADKPCLSVTGIKSRWANLRFPETRFFILTNKGDENEVLSSLRAYDYLRSQIDTLDEYDNNLQKRIVASLAITSLGKKKSGKMMYNDGSLLVCDDKNFNIPKSRKELVCLKIEVNEYMNLTAKTTSFSNPSSFSELKKRRNCVFRISKEVGGFLWEGQSVKPVVVKSYKDEDYKLQDLYIRKKHFADNKNNVPYWPYNPESYTHGKLFVIWQVVNTVNEDFNGILNISFSDFNVIHYDECKSGNEMLSFMQSYLDRKRIYVEDPFNTNYSKNIIDQFMNEAKALIGGLTFHVKPTGDDMIVRLCEPQNQKTAESLYTKSLQRITYSGNALQHIVISGNEKEDVIGKASTRRILIELVVKDSLAKEKLPTLLAELIQGWRFFRYKINNGTVHGASFTADSNGSIMIQEFGLGKNPLGDDFEIFVHDNLKYDGYDKIRGARDYMAMEKNGNVYLIIDTDEIPILDASLINDAYDDIVNKEESETIAKFKRKAEKHKYLRGFIGFHLWKSDGLDGEPDASYSYISGTNSESLQISKGTKMDKMPRARRIFILHQDCHESEKTDIMEIVNMLKFGFGRWNELMTYPFPFKYLQEYLDNSCEIVFSKHWKDITYNGEL